MLTNKYGKDQTNNIMNKANIAAFLAVFFIIGFALGTILVTNQTPIPNEITISNTGMTHEIFQVPSSMDMPSIDLVVHEDPMSGFNIELLLENFTLSPQNASKHHVDGQGHAHLYIEEKRINRIYEEWFHIPSHWLTENEHTITVYLSSNDHRDFANEDGLIFASKNIVVNQ